MVQLDLGLAPTAMGCGDELAVQLELLRRHARTAAHPV